MASNIRRRKPRPACSVAGPAASSFAPLVTALAVSAPAFCLVPRGGGKDLRFKATYSGPIQAPVMKAGGLERCR
jgi:hypothetical protein